MNTEQERADFEVWHTNRIGYTPNFIAADRSYVGFAQERYEAFQAGRAALQSQDREPCTWEHDAEIDAYDTACGNAFIVGEGTPAENDMKFCCYCGRVLREAIDHARRIEGEGK